MGPEGENSKREGDFKTAAHLNERGAEIPGFLALFNL